MVIHVICLILQGFMRLAEGRGFEPPVGLPLRLISSQVPLTTQPPFPPLITKHFTGHSNGNYYARIKLNGKSIREFLQTTGAIAR